jgi:hypothetical protein
VVFAAGTPTCVADTACVKFLPFAAVYETVYKQG